MTGGTAARLPRIVAVDGIPGSGKTSVVAELLARMPGTAWSAVLAPQMDTILPELADDVRAEGGHDIMPSGFVSMARLVDAVMQFHYRAVELASVEWLCFDGWVTGLRAYHTDASVHEHWLRQFAAQLPEPHLLCYLRADPEICYERLVRRDRRIARNWDTPRSLRDLRQARARYDEAMARTDCLLIDASRPVAETVDALLGQLAAASGVLRAAR